MALPAFTPPAETHTTPPFRDICFRHPGYPDSALDLLVLLAADTDSSGRVGLDFDTALAACCIVAGVGGDGGYLTRRRNGQFQCVERGLLCETEYFFCVGDDTNRYPVVPSFQNWRFPHGCLPRPWADLHIPADTDTNRIRANRRGPSAAMDRDISCRVTGYMDALERAHLVPESEQYWFAANRMDQYYLRKMDSVYIHDKQNILTLRRDVHHLFDARKFTFVPKYFPDAGPVPGPVPVESADAGPAHQPPHQPPTLVTHALIPSSPELVGLYHNRLPQPIRDISPECLLARFAWSIFTDEHIPFFQSDMQYTVWVWNKERNVSETRDIRGSDVRSLAQVFGVGRTPTRSVSPKKRPAPQDCDSWSVSDSGSASDYCDHDHGGSGSDYDGYNDDDDDNDNDDDGSRGRRRTRDVYFRVSKRQRRETSGISRERSFAQSKLESGLESGLEFGLKSGLKSGSQESQPESAQSAQSSVLALPPTVKVKQETVPSVPSRANVEV